MQQTCATAETIDVLARTAWAEARGHGLDGMAAVLNVVANRRAQPGWWSRHNGDGIPDDTFRAVCKDPRQFSCWNADIGAGNRILTITRADPHFVDALMLAECLVAGKLRDRTHGADHYHADYVNPPWARGRRALLTIGPAGKAHLFYRIGLRA